MNEDTGQIKPMGEVNKLPEEEGRKWIPFAIGEEIVLKNIVFKIVKVKQLRQEIHLAFVRKVATNESGLSTEGKITHEGYGKILKDCEQMKNSIKEP